METGIDRLTPRLHRARARTRNSVRARWLRNLVSTVVGQPARAGYDTHYQQQQIIQVSPFVSHAVHHVSDCDEVLSVAPTNGERPRPASLHKRRLLNGPPASTADAELSPQSTQLRCEKLSSQAIDMIFTAEQDHLEWNCLMSTTGQRVSPLIGYPP